MSGIHKGFVGRIKTKIIDNKFEMPMVFIVSYTKRLYVAKSWLGKMSWIQLYQP